MNQAMKWTMKTDELDIPAYTGSFLEGEYLGVNSAGTLTGITFKQARLIAKKWQLAFTVGNDLIADAAVDLADWLLALAGEGLANRVDKEGLAGTGLPFVGILNHPDVTTVTLATGKDTFSEIDLDDLSTLIANVEESVLDGAGFYMHRTMWNVIRTKKDTAGNYIIGYPNPTILENQKPGGVRPVGQIWGYPVYTSRHLPASTATAVSTNFLFFGNLKALSFGNRGEMSVAQHQSGTFGGKEIALADQRGLVYRQRHGLAVVLPAAFCVAKTAAS